MSYHVSTIFSQLISILPKNKFDSFVGQHKADRYTKRLSCWQQLQILLFAQATCKESLRDIETWLLMHQNKWYHLWIETVAKSTLADANNSRSYEIYESLFYALLKECNNLAPPRNIWRLDINWEMKFKFDNPLYSLDATVIELCLSMFDWAKYRKAKWALKLHVLLNNKTTIPELIVTTTWKEHEVTVAQKKNTFNLPAESILVFDRWYIDYSWFNSLNDNNIYFVSRTKKNTNYFVVWIHKEPTEIWIISDEIIAFFSNTWMEEYKKDLRLVTYYDKEKDKTYKYMTNNFTLSAKTIADIYKDRWQIELFFKWIKQNLKIKSFLWTSKNAVLTQIWIAMIYYLILCYLKFKTRMDSSLLEITRMIQEVIFERISLLHIINTPLIKIIKIKKILDPPQLSLL